MTCPDCTRAEDEVRISDDDLAYHARDLSTIEGDVLSYLVDDLIDARASLQEQRAVNERLGKELASARAGLANCERDAAESFSTMLKLRDEAVATEMTRSAELGEAMRQFRDNDAARIEGIKMLDERDARIRELTAPNEYSELVKDARDHWDSIGPTGSMLVNVNAYMRAIEAVENLTARLHDALHDKANAEQAAMLSDDDREALEWFVAEIRDHLAGEDERVDGRTHKALAVVNRLLAQGDTP
jgi:uncharacterized protein YdaU (DUF1376 family)